MATLIRLTEDQISHLMSEAEHMENALKDFHEELVTVNVPRETLMRFSRLHDRFTAAVAFVRRQRELAGKDPR